MGCYISISGVVLLINSQHLVLDITIAMAAAARQTATSEGASGASAGFSPAFVPSPRALICEYIWRAKPGSSQAASQSSRPAPKL